MSEITNATFRQQIKDDIELIQDKVSWNQNAKKNEYAFNYWVLSKIYNLDEEISHNYITEYNDKGVDCFVHYEEAKELYIIQNKYYENTKLNSKEVSDFLTRPLARLKDGTYERNADLQKIYSMAAEDPEYKIFLHFYVTNDSKAKDITLIVNNHNSNEGVKAKVFYLSDIKEKYYGRSYQQDASLDFILSLKVKGSALRIRPKEYGLKNMNKGFYVMAKVHEIYELWLQADNEKYPLFEQNIREYLGGTSGINKRIINTLEDPKERHKFFYYNNGITIICQSADADSFNVSLTNPQIVNGCQTVNSIAEVLKDGNYGDEFKEVYVMTKILVIEQSTKDNSFYRDIVKYTNSQNSINERVFGATHEPFFTLQKGIKEWGFLLCVKQSDKHTFKEKYKNDTELKGKLLQRANKISKGFYEHKVNKITDVQINLEHLIQIIGAFKKDAYFAYIKKDLLLKPSNTEYYQNFSLKIIDFFTVKQMMNLIMLYKKGEYDKKKSEDGRTPISYYLLNFLGFYLEQEGIERQTFLEKVTPDQLRIVYEQFRPLSAMYHKKYYKEHKQDYNQMVKQQVDEHIMQEVLNSYFDLLKDCFPDKYKEFKKVISDINL